MTKLQDKQVRIERDFLGEKEVDTQAYYGIQTLRAVENFPITGYHVHEELIKALGIVKKAAALANMDTKRLYSGLGEKIVQAADEVIEGKWNNQFIVDPIQGGAGTSMNMNANEVIANRALELLGKEKGAYTELSPNTHVNMSQSTNDVFPTAIHISTLNMIEKLLYTMENMHQVMTEKAQEFDHVIKMDVRIFRTLFQSDLVRSLVLMQRFLHVILNVSSSLDSIYMKSIWEQQQSELD